MVITCQLDTRNLNRAQQIFFQHTSVKPAQAVNRTALFIVRDAQKRTPFVTSGEIDTDMNVTTSPEITATGRISKDKTKQHGTIIFQNRRPTKEDVSAINTAQRIVLARMHPTSKFNVLTGGRWAITPPDFGRGRQKSTDSGTLFWKWVRDVAERMVKARHSSTHFLQASWSVIIFKLLPHVPPSYRSGMDAPMINPLKKELLSGEVDPAKPGSSFAVCKITNTLGLIGPNKTLNEVHNDAAVSILVPILQSSIDREYDSKMKKADKEGWLEDSSALKSCGCLVRIN